MSIGYADVAIRVDSRGGHSSVPGPHTSIGYLARFITALEDADMYQPILTRDTPYYGYLHCLNEHGAKSKVPPWLEDALEKDDMSDIAHRVAKLGPRSRFILETSKAATVVTGGVKANALPETAEVLFNSRIETTSSVQDHMHAVVKVISPLAEHYDLGLDAFGDVMRSGSEGTVHLSLRSTTEPSPITPWTTKQWDLFAAAVASSFGRQTIVSPSLSTANTDTKHYWNLSTNIMRWTPARLGTRLNAHTVNERIMLSTHIEGVRFFHGTLGSWQR